MGENRLAREKSSYLRSAARQPVEWYPWGEEAFRRAKAEDKPILLDIGAVWCHWCHVIDRESYEDAATARIINERFVPVKVDRDERPDVDARYQRAVAALSGQGGWPLTAFLTPDGKVFFGGTYFPPIEAYGRPSFKQVLAAAAEHYAKEKAEAVKEAESLHKALAPHVHREAAALGEESLRMAEGQLRSMFDRQFGGFGGAPKFPHPGTIEFLLARGWRSRDLKTTEAALVTLRQMALGGVHDQVGGGFHRYSTDARWIVPHFEKMACDNAALLENYAHAFQLTAEPLFREAAEGILRWVASTLSDRERGGFSASQDADVGPEDDGDYFTWTLEELRSALTEDEARVLAAYYDVREVGEMHERPDRNVLFVSEGVESIARALRMPTEQVRTLLHNGRKRLLDARNARPAPFVDRTIYANWNGMFVAASLEAYAAFGDEAARDFALRTLDRLLRETYAKEKGFAHQLADGAARVHGLLDDQVQMARALLAAFDATANAWYLRVAESLAALLQEHWWDPTLGGFLDVAPRLREGEGAAMLDVPYRPIQDAPTPAGNAVAALVFGKLHAVTGKEEYRQTQEAILRTFASEGERIGALFAGTYFQALDAFVNPPAQIVITGDPGDERTKALQWAALNAYHPGRTVVLAGGGYVPEAAKAMLDSPLAKEGPVAFVCKGTVCLPPIADPEALRRALSTA